MTNRKPDGYTTAGEAARVREGKTGVVQGEPVRDPAVAVYFDEPLSAPIVPAPAYGVKNRDIKELWVAHGGSQHGPRVETYTIPEVAFWKFIDSLRERLSSAPVEEADAKAGAATDRLPSGHVVLEQSDILDGLVSQTVRIAATGAEYERVVHADEAYGYSDTPPASTIPSEPEAKGEAGAGPVGEAVEYDDAGVAIVEFTTLRQANRAREASWYPADNPDLSFRGNEMAGEVGEACNVIKKLERERLGWNGSRDTVYHLAEELADVVITADFAALKAGIDLDKAIIDKFNAFSRKIGVPQRLIACSTPTVRFVMPGLHSDTAELVAEFASALAKKLLAAQAKYGHTNGWKTADWEGECKSALMRHVHKGDALDVAAYAAFCWSRGWATSDNTDAGGNLADREARPSLPDSREEQIREDERQIIARVIRRIAQRFEPRSASQNNHRALADAIESGDAFSSADRTRARQGGSHG